MPLLVHTCEAHAPATDSDYTLISARHGCRVRRYAHHGQFITDRLTFTRLRLSGPILERVIGTTFRHRHRLLRERFGGCAA
jgi:hypothetical protein